ILLAILLDSREPGIAQLPAALSNPFTEMIVDSIRHVELIVLWPAVVSFGQPDLLFAQRFAVSAARILLVRRAITNMAVDDNQRRPILRGLKVPKGTR